MSEILTQDDIQFLKDLGTELKTQDNRCTAKPLIFQIREEKNIVGMDLDYSDDTVLLIGDEYHEFYEVEDAIEFLLDCDYLESDDLEDEEFNDLAELYEFLDARDMDYITLTGVSKEDSFKEFFLTAKACDNHIKMNHYHYKKPDSYAKHAWRSPELERLLEIVEKFAEEEDKEHE